MPVKISSFLKVFFKPVFIALISFWLKKQIYISVLKGILLPNSFENVIKCSFSPAAFFVSKVSPSFNSTILQILCFLSRHDIIIFSKN